ncbi:MAG: PIN domain-containing protein [Clostridia bacterium]|nr:PIN domain-containing protein [Clostridia bacterium]
MVILDTNAVLRFLLGDQPDMARQTQACIQQNAVLIPIEVIAEIVYVLSGVYEVNRNEVQSLVSRLVKTRHIHTPNDALVLCAMDFYGKTSLDFVDCLMLGYRKVCAHDVLTFDKKLQACLRDIVLLQE